MLVHNATERRGYVDTQAGQIHYRATGSDDGETVVLLHWAPGSSHQYAATLQALAAHDCHAIAPDLPGFGMSCRREGLWTIGDFAANVLEAIGRWVDGPVVLWGGHLAAEIALEVALLDAGRVTLLVLDGTPTWDEATRKKILTGAIKDAPEADEQGAHLAELWQHLLWEVGMWRPDARFDARLARFTMELMAAKMLADFDTRPAHALLNYDALSALSRASVPVVVLTADGDPLRDCHETVIARLSGSPGVTQHVYPGDHPVHDPERAEEYVAPVLARMRKLTRQ